MKKLKEYSAHTNTMGFNLEILLDEEKREYVARISPYTPPIMEQYIPGQEVANMNFEEIEEYRDIDEKNLFETCKARMEKLGQGKLIITETKNQS